MPLHVVRQQTQKDMGLDVVGGAVENGPHPQIQSLQAAEGPLHRRQAFVAAHGVGGAQPLRSPCRVASFGDRGTGADDINPVEILFLADRLFPPRPTRSSEQKLSQALFMLADHLTFYR